MNDTSCITVSVRDVIATVDRKIYGTIIEPIGRCIHDGLEAEMLHNRKFWGPPGDGLPLRWERLGDSADAEYTLDPDEPYSPPVALRLTLGESEGGPRGIQQPGLEVAQGQCYRWYEYLRAAGFSGQVTVGLMRDGQFLSAQVIDELTEDWRCYAFKSEPLEGGPAQWVVAIEGEGTLWVDSVSLMPADHVNGVRRDVLQTIKRLNVSLIRFPGGCFSDMQHWMNAVGPRDRRPAEWNAHYGELESNDFGTDEFMALCRELGCQAYLNVNHGTGTPEEAAAWVEYCNGPVESRYGALRAGNGHPEAYNVGYWGVGNEVYGRWEAGHTDARTYARHFCQYHDAMKAADPGIRMIAVGCEPHPFYDTSWNVAMLKNAGGKLNYLSMHKYVPGAGTREKRLERWKPEELYGAVVASPHALERTLRQMAEVVDLVLGDDHRVQLNLDEWGIWIDVDRERGIIQRARLRDALFAAGLFNALWRLSGPVGIGIQSLLVNEHGAIMTNQTDCYLSAIGVAFALYANHTGDVALRTRLESPTFDTYHCAETPGMRGVPYLDCAATLRGDGRRLYLAIINRHPAQDLTAEINLQDCFPMPGAWGHELNGGDVYAENSFTDKEAISIRTYPVERVADRMRYRFPAHSVTILEIALR